MSAKFDPDEMRNSISHLRAVLPLIIENSAVMAQITRAKYNALLKEGFTEKQAIELCKTDSPFS